LDELGFVGSLADLDRMIVGLSRNMSDPRTVLVLEPLRWAMATRPRWLAWEQVPAVLPIWEVSAELLRAMGYSVRTGILSAETFGVPQTRRRAFLIARRLDVAALHGAARFPNPTHARYRHGDQVNALELDTVRPWVSMAEALGWTGRVGFPRAADRDDVATIGGVDYRARDLRDVDAPAQVVTEKARSWTRFALAGRAFSPGGRTVVDGLQPRELAAPAHTITGGGSAMWLDALDGEGLRVTVEEAAALQTFPPDYPWAGSLSSRFQQIGDAVPPILARVILEAIRA
jgi:DNA (cytosine-5)-methyltransferase 1